MIINQRFDALGLRLTYGKHVDERDAFDLSSIASRVADLHAAFTDPRSMRAHQFGMQTPNAKVAGTVSRTGAWTC